MRCIMHPEYQTYNRAILNHYGHDSQDQNYFFLLASFKAWLHGASDIFNDTQNRPKTKQVACMKKKTSISQNEMKVGELLLYHVENKIIGLLQKKFFKEEIETLQEDEWKKSYILGNKKSTEVQHLPSRLLLRL